MMTNPSGRIDRQQKRDGNAQGYQNARDRYSASLQASIERREKRRREEEEARRKAELQAQQDAAQAQRDKQQQKYGQADTAQRAYYAANDAADDFNRTKQLNRQQQKDVRRRDTLNNDFSLTRDREQARDQQDRDQLQFGFSTKENEQKFGYQMMENDQQFGHQLQRDRFQHGNTLERDAMQFGFDSRRADQTHGNTMQRDSALNEFDTQRDVRQNQFQGERDNRLNMFDTQRDARQQQYTQQNQYQRETAEVSARWQEQIQQARNAGLDFSEAQKKEMKELEETFRKNVLNGPYDDGQKQQIMLEHQKKLSAIIPNEKIANPTEGLNSSLIFHEPTKSWYMQGRDSKGFPTYEPLGGPNDGVAEQQQMQMQMQEKERQQKLKETDDLRKVKLDRLNRFNDIVREKQAAENALGNKMYADPMKAAQEEFQRHDEFYQQEYGLPPLFPQKEQAGNGNPFRANGTMSGSPQPSTFRPTTGPQKPKLPVISHNAPLPSQVSDSLRTIPGGNQLQEIRDKYKSNTPEDQTVRLATTIVINAIMTEDTSDPDYEQALKILKGAGYNIGQ